KFIKLAASPLSGPFTELYNESIMTGTVPDIFKFFRVTPMFKSGDPCEPGNYRPIAILSSFSKILEKLVYDQLIFYL
ncbi:predicted protein, partial [Nematostella vectensis]